VPVSAKAMTRSLGIPGQAHPVADLADPRPVAVSIGDLHRIASSENHARASRPQSSCDTAGPPGAIPPASAAATYLRTVFRDSPRLPESRYRPARMPVHEDLAEISITSNVLLAIGPRPFDGGMIVTAR
jgi:hypothetical protein